MTTPANIEVQRYAPQPDGRLIGTSACIQDENETWIMFLDDDGKPYAYWGERDELGGVIGDPVNL